MLENLRLEGLEIHRLVRHYKSNKLTDWCREKIKLAKNNYHIEDNFLISNSGNIWKSRAMSCGLKKVSTMYKKYGRKI